MEPEHGVWHLMIEENVGFGQSMYWALTRTQPFASHEEALAAADATARWYEPHAVWNTNHRLVFRSSGDIWTVWLDSGGKGLHFRVSVAQYVAPFQA